MKKGEKGRTEFAFVNEKRNGFSSLPDGFATILWEVRIGEKDDISRLQMGEKREREERKEGRRR